jgi:hypothetical protein
MCMGGGGSPKVETPKPPPLPPPLPPPAPPKPAPAPVKKLAEPDTKPDIRIGTSKKSTSGRERRTSSLSIGSSGSNQGLNL